LFIEKVRDIVGLYLNPPERALVLCVADKSQIQALDRTRPIPPLRPGVPARQSHDYLHNGVTFRQRLYNRDLLRKLGVEGPVLEMVPLDSSVFRSVAYLHGKDMLCLKFHSGEIYCYFEFSPEQYEQFLSADSKGQYFAHKIRDRFRYRRMRRRQS
jgi:hypothetical protein